MESWKGLRSADGWVSLTSGGAEEGRSSKSLPQAPGGIEFAKLCLGGPEVVRESFGTGVSVWLRKNSELGWLPGRGTEE